MGTFLKLVRSIGMPLLRGTSVSASPTERWNGTKSGTCPGIETCPR